MAALAPAVEASIAPAGNLANKWAGASLPKEPTLEPLLSRLIETLHFPFFWPLSTAHLHAFHHLYFDSPRQPISAFTQHPCSPLSTTFRFCCLISRFVRTRRCCIKPISYAQYRDNGMTSYPKPSKLCSSRLPAQYSAYTLDIGRPMPRRSSGGRLVNPVSDPVW